SLAVPSVLQERDPARLGNGSKHLPDRWHLSGQSNRDRAVQLDCEGDASPNLDEAVRRPDWILGRPPSPRPRLCAVGPTRCEKLTKSFLKRVTEYAAPWVTKEHGAAEEEERTREQISHLRADPARGNRHGSRIRRDHGRSAGKTGGRIR